VLLVLVLALLEPQLLLLQLAWTLPELLPV
jgi:hypothetical protein